MRFDLRLHGLTSDGKKCLADITIYAMSQKEMLKEAQKAGGHGPWRYAEGAEEWVAEGSKITVENVENRAKEGTKAEGKPPWDPRSRRRP